MIPLTLRELADACGARLSRDLSPDYRVASVCTDTRFLQPGAVFLALKGERFDGHRFLAAAAAAGAHAAVVSVAPYRPPLPLIVVPDTLKALGDLAGRVRQKSGVKLVGVTGSVGKTTTKEMVAAVLGSRFSTLKSEANQNNEIGVPATLLRLESTHQAAVVELAMRARGEIQYLSEIARPDAAIITNIGSAHIGRLGSQEAIAKAKAEIFTGLQPGGVAILNRDDSFFDFLASRAARSLSFGIDSGADVTARDLVDRGPEGAQFVCRAFNEEVAVTLPIGGQHIVLDSLATLAAGVTLGVPLTEGAAALASVQPASGRGEVVTQPDGRVIINDTYNASTDSVEAALKLLAGMAGHPRKVAVLGDMLEMGDYAEEGHRRVARAAVHAGLTRLVCVGSESRAMEDEACKTGMRHDSVCWYPGSKEAAAEATSWSAHSDVILVKGSNSMRMGLIVEALVAMGDGR